MIGAVVLVWQGVPMNFHHDAVATTVEGTKQVIPQGRVTALEIIKNLNTKGGGFFNANGAHPYENPTALTNFLEMLAIVLLPAALTNTFGRMVGQPRQGWMFYYVIVFLFACCCPCTTSGSEAIGRFTMWTFEVVVSSRAEIWKGRKFDSASLVLP